MPGKKASEEARREQILQAAFRVAVREELEQLTIRQVAAEAGLSTGLVFFHFKSKEALLLALLDRLLDALFENWDVSESSSPTERLLAWLKLDLQDISQDEQGHMKVFFQDEQGRMKVFLSYWMLAVRDPLIDARIRDALERSKRNLLPIVQAVIEGEPERFHQVTPEGLVTVVLAITQGIAMQSLIGNQYIDVEHILLAVRALLLPSPPEERGQ